MAPITPSKVVGYSHTGITVRCMADSLRFWKDTLGFPIAWEQRVTSDIPGQPCHTITGAPSGSSMHVVWLTLPQTPHSGGSSDPGHVSMLELIEYELPADAGEEDKSRTPHARSWDIAAVHVALMVRGLDGIVANVKELGFSVYGGIFQVPGDSPQVEARGQRICYLRGPDGETVELTEIPGEA